jgi:hypothetical protein
VCSPADCGYPLTTVNNPALIPNGWQPRASEHQSSGRIVRMVHNDAAGMRWAALVVAGARGPSAGYEVDAYRGDPGFETTLTYERRRLRATSNTAAAMVNSATTTFIQRRAIRPVAKPALPHLESRLRVAAAHPRAARHSLSP